MTNLESGENENVKSPLEQAFDALDEALPLTDEEREELELVITGGWDNWNDHWTDDEKDQMRIETAEAFGVEPSSLADEQVVRWHSTQFFLEEDILPRLEKIDPAVKNLDPISQAIMKLNHWAMERDQDSK